jgi:signal transduction histidine kinase
VNQTLFSVSLTADAAALLVDTEPERAKTQLREIRELVRAAMDEMRSLIFELRPGDVGSDGLAVTLEKHVDVLRRVHGTDIQLELDGVEVEPELEREVFRVTQEAIGNALKHASPEHVRVDVRRDGRRLVVTVEDDGSGFDPEGAQARRHLGLISMRERAEAIGGALSVRSKPGAGTTVQLEVDDPRPHR